MKKITAQITFFQVYDEKEVIEIVDGWKTTIRPKGWTKEISVFIHRKEKAKLYSCSHYETGRLLTFGETRKAACSNSEIFLEEKGEELFNERVAKFTELNK